MVRRVKCNGNPTESGRSYLNAGLGSPNGGRRIVQISPPRLLGI